MRRKKIIPPVVKNRWGAWNKWRCTNCRNVLPAGSEVWEANTSDIKAEYGDYLCKDCAKKILEEKRRCQMSATLTPMPCGDVINHCVEFVRECERDFDLRNAGLHYRFVVSGRAAREFRSHFIVTSTDIMGRTIFDGSTTLMGHPCEIRMDASEPITLVFIPKGGVA